MLLNYQFSMPNSGIASEGIQKSCIMSGLLLRLCGMLLSTLVQARRAKTTTQEHLRPSLHFHRRLSAGYPCRQ